MKAICRTCHRDWIISIEHEGPLENYECPICEQKRLKAQKKRPYGTANSNKAKN